MICKWLAFVFILTTGSSLLPAWAATNGATLVGTVTSASRPAAHARVVASGGRLVVATTTDTAGNFRFGGLPVGTYSLEARAASGAQARLRVDLGSGGATVALALEPAKVIVNVVATSMPPEHGSGSDVSLNAAALTRLPFNGSFPEMLIQLPGAVRGANGVVHINGDHGVINYQIDAVALPQALNRDIGSELNLNDIAFADVIEGAYPAQYGLKFGSVLNLSTRSGTGSPGFDGNASLGSYSDVEQTLGYHLPLARGGGASFAAGSQHTTRGLDPPNFGSPHDDASETNQFARLRLAAGPSDFVNVTLIRSYATFQIPNDVDGGEPASTDDNESQEDSFLSVQFRHALGTTGSLTFGPAMKISRIRDFGDPVRDFAYGEEINRRNGGTAADCKEAVATGVYGPATCAFSLADDRTAIDAILQSDYSNTFGRHDVRAGVAWDGTKVDKHYAVTLQPNNFLAPILTPASPAASTTVVDDSPNVANTYQSYVQDSWRANAAYQLEYGLRYDFFTVTSSDFRQSFGSFSPRVKLTRFFGPRASIYAYAGRFFEPFSFENVGPAAAHLLNLPLQPSASQFDLKPERDTQIEFGGHVPLGGGSLGFRVWQKNANDLIDDTQVGVTLLHQDINYVLGRLSQEALTYVSPLALNGRAYFSVAHTVSLNKGCETQLLAPCFGSPTDFTPADHDQSYSIAGGILLNDRRGGWLSADGEYGSGLSSAACAAGTPGYCKRTPHATFNLEKGIGLAPKFALTLGIQNLLNDRYFVTLENAQGNHYAPPRTFDIGIRFGQ